MTPLVKVPKHTWPQLRDLFITSWPKGAAAYCLLDTQINNPKLSERFNFEVYCPFGDINNGMVAFTNKGGSNYVSIAPVSDIEKMVDALITTDLVDWTSNVMIPFATPDAVECLTKVSKKISIKLNCMYVKAIKHFLPNNAALFDISLPPDTYISSLTPNHIETIDKCWAYHGEQTGEFFKALMENDMTYVLYSHDDKPMSWITVGETGAFTHLFCLEQFRRRGYAEIVTKFACNDLLRKGRHILAYTVEENDKSQKLLDKLGFEVIGQDYWSGFNQVFIQPVNSTEKIEEALIKTNLVDWNKNIIVPFASPDTVDSLKRVTKEINANMNCAYVKAIKHLLPNSAVPFEISLPPDTYISSLTPDHIETVDKSWTYHGEQTGEFFEALMENDMTYVLYSHDDKPMSWITVSESGAFTHLYCLEPYRRRGYAELITKFACNDLLKKGRHVITYTLEENVKSKNLFDKLGFVVIGHDYWVHIENKSQ